MMDWNQTHDLKNRMQLSTTCPTIVFHPKIMTQYQTNGAGQVKHTLKTRTRPELNLGRSPEAHTSPGPDQLSTKPV